MILWLILAIGLGTYLMRLSFILLLGRRPLPAAVWQVLRLVPPAVLSALIVPALLLPGGQLDLTTGNARLLAGLLAALVAWRTKNVLLTLGTGLGGLLLLQALR